MTDLAATIRQAIAKAEKRGITRYQLSQRSGVDQAVLSRFVNHGCDLNLTNASKLCAALGLNLVANATPQGRK